MYTPRRLSTSSKPCRVRPPRLRKSFMERRRPAFRPREFGSSAHATKEVGVFDAGVAVGALDDELWL
jgi:hypothetical protein